MAGIRIFDRTSSGLQANSTPRISTPWAHEPQPFTLDEWMLEPSTPLMLEPPPPTPEQVTAERLMKFVSLDESKAWEYADYLEAARKKFEINTPQRVAHWMAQMATECGDFKGIYGDYEFTEALRYSNVKYGLSKFKSAFSSIKEEEDRIEKFEELQKNVEGRKAFANFIYGYEGNNLGNIVGSDDGFDYRGRGFIQITGRYNYDVASKAIGQNFVANPELVAQPRWAAMTAAHFWFSKGLNALADKDDIDAITVKVNAGKSHFEERKADYQAAKGIWRMP